MIPVSLRPLALAMIMLLATLTTAWAQSNVADERAFRRGADDYAAGDFAGALDEWRALALKGHVGSMNNVAIMYAQGKGTAANPELAFVWYRRASDAGNPLAMLNLGISYEQGRGVDADDREAARWYLRAARNQLTEGMNALAWLLATSPDPEVRDGAEAVRWARTAVEREPNAARLDTLAAAHAEAGEFEDAIAAIDQAIDLLKRDAEVPEDISGEDEILEFLRQEGHAEELDTLLERQAQFRNGQAIRD